MVIWHRAETLGKCFSQSNLPRRFTILREETAIVDLANCHASYASTQIVRKDFNQYDALNLDRKVGIHKSGVFPIIRNLCTKSILLSLETYIPVS